MLQDQEIINSIISMVRKKRPGIETSDALEIARQFCKNHLFTKKISGDINVMSTHIDTSVASNKIGKIIIKSSDKQKGAANKYPIFYFPKQAGVSNFISNDNEIENITA